MPMDSSAPRTREMKPEDSGMKEPRVPPAHVPDEVAEDIAEFLSVYLTMDAILEF